MTLKDFKPQAVMTICNTLAIEIMLDESGDYLYYKYSNSDEVVESEIVYEDTCTGIDCDVQSEPFFYTVEGIKYDLNDFIRTNL